MAHVIPELDKKGLRQFGLMAGGFVIGIFGFLFPWLKGSEIPLWPWILGAAFIAWALIAPSSIKHLYKVWMTIAMFIGSIINRVVLSIAFFGVLLPIGLIMRLTGKTPIQSDLDKDAETYRVISVLDKKEKMEKPF